MKAYRNTNTIIIVRDNSDGNNNSAFCVMIYTRTSDDVETKHFDSDTLNLLEKGYDTDTMKEIDPDYAGELYLFWLEQYRYSQLSRKDQFRYAYKHFTGNKHTVNCDTCEKTSQIIILLTSINPSKEETN